MSLTQGALQVVVLHLTMNILIATRNKHKLTEIKNIFGALGFKILSLDDVGTFPEIEEDGETFAANAVKKAETIAHMSGCLTLADDSGLEVDALNGAPGIYSARYAGEPSNDKKNLEKLLFDMKEESRRTARFHCVIAVSQPGQETQTVHGICEGHILREARGTRGFGYDPVFVPDGYEQTFAELGEGLKNKISHRAVALTKAKVLLEKSAASS